jgi:hypothetical protein
MIFRYLNGDCLYVQFTIFDYVTRKIVFECIYDKLEFLRDYNVEVLYKLVKSSYKTLLYESTPFL